MDDATKRQYFSKKLRIVTYCPNRKGQCTCPAFVDTDAVVKACKQDCTDAGYCCAEESSYSRPSCKAGCEHGAQTMSLEMCEADCSAAEGQHIVWGHNQHGSC